MVQTTVFQQNNNIDQYKGRSLNDLHINDDVLETQLDSDSDIEEQHNRLRNEADFNFTEYPETDKTSESRENRKGKGKIVRKTWSAKEKKSNRRIF